MNQLQSLLRTAKSGLKGKSIASTLVVVAAPVLSIGQGKGEKRKAPSKQNKKGKSQRKLLALLP